MEPAELLDVREQNTPNGLVVEVLIGWNNLPRFEATWEKFFYYSRAISIF